MDKLYRIIAFGYKAIKFCFDIWQIWQFAMGGSLAGIVAGVIAFIQKKPIWLSIVLAIAVGIFAVCVISLIFKSYTFGITESKGLRRLPRLVYDMHRRRCSVREKFINKIDWDAVDTSKVLIPVIEWLTRENQGASIDDETLNNVESELNEIGSVMHGAPSVFMTMMQSSDTDLERVVEKDCRYRVMQANLDTYKPYPNETIRRDIETVIYGSKIFNNVIVFQLYLSEPLSLESLSRDTKLSDIKRGQVYLVNANVEEIMDTNIDKACTRLSEHIEEYFSSKKGNK